MRITSTYVENTYTMGPRKTSYWDHLHIRGEYLMSLGTVDDAEGSPPHTWRIPQLPILGEVTVRITSTYVENT